MKKSNKKKMILLCTCLAIFAVTAVTIALVLGGSTEDKKYSEHIEQAKKYLITDDYESAKEIYLEAIEIFPDQPEAYKELVSIYIEEEDYENAYQTAEEGYNHTGDEFFAKVMERVMSASKQAREGRTAEVSQQVFSVEKKDSTDLSVRFMVLDNISSFCYQQYLDSYGTSDISSVDVNGYGVKFAGLTGKVYFQNSTEQPEAVDTASRKISKRAKPYEVDLSSPSMLFVGYNGYVSYEKLQAIFGITEKPEKDENEGWWLSFTTNGCNIKMETDESGNLSGQNPEIIISPVDLVTVAWEEPEEETTEEEEPDTFVLGGNTYRYDVTVIDLYNVSISDLSELANCKQLQTLSLVKCGIQDITPLQYCESLVELCLDENPFTDISPIAGLPNLQYLQFHESGVSDISPIFDMELKLMNPCSPGVSREQVEEYKRRHPGCVCFWNYYQVF